MDKPLKELKTAEGLQSPFFAGHKVFEHAREIAGPKTHTSVARKAAQFQSLI
jgi:hypothetical protein